MRQSYNRFRQWFEENMADAPYEMLCSAAYADYRIWSAERSYGVYTASLLTRWLKKRGVEVRKSSGKQFYVGLSAKDDFTYWFESGLILPVEALCSDVYDRYLWWCAEYEYQVKTQHALTSWLKKHHRVEVRKSAGKRYYVFGSHETGDWLAQNMDLTPMRVPSHEIYDNYVEWCNKRGCPMLTQKRLTTWLKKTAGVSVYESDGTRYYIGLSPKAQPVNCETS